MGKKGSRRVLLHEEHEMNKIPCFYCNFLKLDHQVCADLQVGNTISLNKTEDGKKKEKKKKKKKEIPNQKIIL